jgi:flagellar biosynthesis/type III secretory pathway M-ring protein FliF/YscJ
MANNKIIITVKGGIVTMVYTDIEGIKESDVAILDYDNDFDNDEDTEINNKLEDEIKSMFRIF